jgi:hypothetical protein
MPPLLPLGERSEQHSAALCSYSLSGTFENRLILAAIKGSASAKTDETTLSAVLENVEDSEG